MSPRDAALALTLALGLAGCGGRAASTGDGTVAPPADPCRQAYDRMKSCVDGLSCAAFTDATKKAICEALKSGMPATYQQSLDLCEQQTPGQCACTGARRDAALKLLSCALDEVCICPGGP